MVVKWNPVNNFFALFLNYALQWCKYLCIYITKQLTLQIYIVTLYIFNIIHIHTSIQQGNVADTFTKWRKIGTLMKNLTIPKRWKFPRLRINDDILNCYIWTLIYILKTINQVQYYDTNKNIKKENKN